MARLLQKERLKSPQKSLIIENQAFWVIFAILAKTAILVVKETKRPGLSGRPHCKGVAIGVASRVAKMTK